MLMMLTGLIAKESPLWRAECEIVGAFTQGKSRKDAAVMLAGCIQAKVDRADFKVTVTEIGENDDGSISVFITANEPGLLAAEVLKYQRDRARLTQQQAAERSGGKYQADFAVYERGEREPSLSKFIALLGAVAPELALQIGPRGPAVAKKKASR